MNNLRILVVDDEPAVRKFVRANLEAGDYKVIEAVTGTEAISIIERELPDLMILDILVPEMDGFEVCRRIREWSQIPIIMLSGRVGEEDKVRCLELGADDYITKPFGVNELRARVKAVLRRTQALEGTSDQPVFCCGELTIDFSRHRVILGENDLNLTATEYRILSYLAMNAGRVVTTNQILEKVWGQEYIGETHLLQVNIARLRQKLGDDARNPKYIQTKPDIGYIMVKNT